MLEKINSPADIKLLRQEELEILAEDIRRVIIETCSKNGGHLASSLGVVELTIALHYVFKNQAETKSSGMSATRRTPTTNHRPPRAVQDASPVQRHHRFSRWAERSFDTYNTGHGSTAIAAAPGLAEGRDLNSRSTRSSPSSETAP